MKQDTPIPKLNKVGQVTGNKLRRLGLKTALDLLYHFPFRYEDYSKFTAIADLEIDKQITVKGKVEIIQNRRIPRQRRFITEAIIGDDTGRVKAVWFNQPFLAKTLPVGTVVYLSGKLTSGVYGEVMTSPVYEKDVNKETTHTARIVPVYRLTAGLTQKQLRFLCDQVMGLADGEVDWLPEDIKKDLSLLELGEALKKIHFPSSEADIEESRRRVKFDEIFLSRLRVENFRLKRSQSLAPKLVFKEKEIRDLVSSLPFTLTGSQKVSAWEILRDIGRKMPMNRLLSGDVGSGKTVVAGLALYSAVLNGTQAALMAPTEILAKQHFDSLRELFGDKVNIALFTASQSVVGRKEPESKSQTGLKKEFLKKLKGGEIDVAVGTQALLSDNVVFKNLALAAVDEQHRFGVRQRKALKEKGLSVHFLSMTATPIPRSLALALYGDLDVSVINELPKGRKKILTRLVEPLNRQKAYDFIREQIKKGRQAFVICPLIQNEGEEFLADIDYAADKKTVLGEYQKLSEKVFPDLKISFLHGKMKASEKDKIMNDFKEGKADILVSTSVVEVGVDIPNASVMMIEGAENFGLSQLHQFRGRVGRSAHQSYCFLFTEKQGKKAMERLRFFEKTHDGFKLAEKDLLMRGAGEVYGTAQSGISPLKMIKLTDKELIKQAVEWSKKILPRLADHELLRSKVEEWEKENGHLE